MHNDAKNAEPLEVKVTFPGAECFGNLEEFDVDGASIRLGVIRPLWIGRFAAISFKDLPALTGFIREVDGDRIYIAFENPLHQSWVEEASPSRSKFADHIAA